MADIYALYFAAFPYLIDSDLPFDYRHDKSPSGQARIKMLNDKIIKNFLEYGGSIDKVDLIISGN